MQDKSELFDAKNKVLAELTSGHKDTKDSFMQLLNILIEEGHRDNEEARGEDFLITQGGIKMCRDILSSLNAIELGKKE